MKKFLIVLLLCLAVPAWADDDNFLGRWQAKEAGHKIFEGRVSIVRVKTNQGASQPNMLLIYDEQKHGLLCGKIADRFKQKACLMVETTKSYITAADKADNVTKALKDVTYLVVNLRPSDENLIIEGYPLDTRDCVIDMNCEYGILSVLTRN